MREGALIFFLALTALAASVVAPTKSEVEAMYATAAHELSAGHYREALRKLDALDARQPDVAAAHNLRGVAWMRLGEYRKAEAALRKARELDPNFWEARFNLAELPFLTGDWAEARRRFTALTAEPNKRLQAATSDLLQFKILLTFLLERKEKSVTPILEKLKSSTESPALYYAKAALALQRKDRAEARSWMGTAEKEFSPASNKLFAESFYEAGWLSKPEGALPVALEVASPAERIARGQEDLARAERAYRQGDLEAAWNLLEQLEATAPGQSVTHNLRGEILLAQGKIDEAETALRSALEADPQLLSARYNLARVSIARKNYESARKDFEALLGATSGGKDPARIEQRIRYQIFLSLLMEGREAAAQKAMEEFKMMDDSPALYYAQAAWAFQHGNSSQGNNWVSNARNLFSTELNRSFASSFADLGWPARTEARPTPGPVAVVQAEPSPPPVIENPPAPPKESKPIVAASETTPPAVPVIADAPKPTAPADLGLAFRIGSSSTRATTPARKKRPSRASVAAQESAKRARQIAAQFEAPHPSPPAEPPPVNVESPPARQNLGDKLARLLSYPFKRRSQKTNPLPTELTASGESARSSPTPAARTRPKN